MIPQFMAMRREIEELKRHAASNVWFGTIAEVDGEKALARVKLQESGGEPFLSPWLPWHEIGGAFKSWVPPVAGEIVKIVSPVGDLRQGYIHRGQFGGENLAPSSDLEANVWTYGSWTITLREDSITITGGDTTVEITTETVMAQIGTSVFRVDPERITALAGLSVLTVALEGIFGSLGPNGWGVLAEGTTIFAGDAFVTVMPGAPPLVNAKPVVVDVNPLMLPETAIEEMPAEPGGAIIWNAPSGAGAGGAGAVVA